MSKNSKFECDYCPANLFTATYLNHLLSKHFDKFLCSNELDAVKNRKALSKPIKNTPIVLYGKTIPYYCCMKCNTACKGETICDHYHFNREIDTKNHSQEHLLGCATLLEKVNNRMNNEPERVVEKVVQKVIYKPVPDDKTIFPFICKGFSVLINKINNMIYDNQVVGEINNRLRTVIDKQDVEIKRLKHIEKTLLDMLSIDGENITKEATKMITTSDMGERVYVIARDKVKETIDRDDDFDPFDEYEDDLSGLKEVFPNISLKEIDRHTLMN